MTIREIIKSTSFVCSDEDDKQSSSEKIKEAEVTGGKFVQIVAYDDEFAYENKTHYLINECGTRELRLKIQ